jgi:hypothetical protein
MDTLNTKMLQKINEHVYASGINQRGISFVNTSRGWQYFLKIMQLRFLMRTERTRMEAQIPMMLQ